MTLKADKLEGKNLYRVTARVEGKPDFTIELRADDEWKARTRVMVFYPYDLSGEFVAYDVTEVK